MEPGGVRLDEENLKQLHRVCCVKDLKLEPVAQ